jgi:ubiquitin-like-conjugating enzyme ATG3
VTRGVPCLRRATSLAYTDADEDAERLLNFGDSWGTGGEADEWVETHAGRKLNVDSASNPGIIDDIPDLDGLQEADEGVTHQMGNMSLSGSKDAAGEIPDMDEIPDMEEDGLEEADDATVAPKATTGGVIDVRYELLFVELVPSHE